jgi:thioredoxin 1
MPFYIEISSEDEFKFFTQYSGVCVVDFHAQWCGPCKKLSPILQSKIEGNTKYFDNLFTKESNISKSDVENKLVFIKVNVTDYPELSGSFNVSSIPYIVFFKNGKLQSESVKGLDVDSVIKLIDTFLL